MEYRSVISFFGGTLQFRRKHRSRLQWKRVNGKMKGGLIMVNLPSQGEKSRAQRHSKNWQLEAKALYIWSQCLIKGNYQWTADCWEVVNYPPLADFRWALDPFWELLRQEHSQEKKWPCSKSGGGRAAWEIPACPDCVEGCCGWEGAPQQRPEPDGNPLPTCVSVSELALAVHRVSDSM